MIKPEWFYEFTWTSPNITRIQAINAYNEGRRDFREGTPCLPPERMHGADGHKSHSRYYWTEGWLYERSISSNTEIQQGSNT